MARKLAILTQNTPIHSQKNNHEILTQNTPIYTKKYHEIYTQKIIMKF
jgi:hypothetical protein